MWEKIKEATRHRDEELQGNVNPVLADFGDETEAKQYSGRLIEPDWHPPFISHPGMPGEVSDLTPPPEAPGAGCPINHRAASPGGPKDV